MIMKRLSLIFCICVWAAALCEAAEPINISSRLELFVDDALLERLSGAERRLHHPVPANVALVLDRPWEGGWSSQFTVLRDNDLYRLYYRASKEDAKRVSTCYAESHDGVAWTRPSLKQFEVAETLDNNVVLTQEVAGYAVWNFCPFLDTRPGVPSEERYKAVGGLGEAYGGLFAFDSPDGIRWRKLSDKPVITKGDFDAVNVAFWDTERKEYRAYARGRRVTSYLAGIQDPGTVTLKTDDQTGRTKDGRDNGRDIITCTSKDFIHWTVPEFVSYSPGRVNELYENFILPYYRAPHLLLGFPLRYIDRGWTESAKALPEFEHREKRGSLHESREATALTDTMLMSSRDRTHFSMWPESFIRPGLRLKDSWTYYDNAMAWGLIETPSSVIGAPYELSLFAMEAFLRPGPPRLRRFTLRMDGFVSVCAPLSGGELLTRPVVFAGSKLVLNYSTSAAGSVQVELQDAQGVPLRGFALADCYEIYGDQIERVVTWKDNSDLGKFAKAPVRLRFVLKDADLYSIQFRL